MRHGGSHAIGVHRRRDVDSRCRHRRLHGDVQHRPCGPAAAVRGPLAGADRHAVGGGHPPPGRGRAHLFGAAGHARADAVVRGHRARGIGQLGRHLEDPGRRPGGAVQQRRVGHVLRGARCVRTPRSHAERQRRRAVGGAGDGVEPCDVDAVLRRGSHCHRPQGADERRRNAGARRDRRRDAVRLLLPARRPVPGRRQPWSSPRSPPPPATRSRNCWKVSACSMAWAG